MTERGDNGWDAVQSAPDGLLPSTRAQSGADFGTTQSEAEIAALKQKVMTAVRSAISESILERNPASAPVALVDLDFSMPVTRNAAMPPLAGLAEASSDATLYPRADQSPALVLGPVRAHAPRYHSGGLWIGALVLTGLLGVGGGVLAFPDLGRSWVPPPAQPIAVGRPAPSKPLASKPAANQSEPESVAAAAVAVALGGAAAQPAPPANVKLASIEPAPVAASESVSSPPAQSLPAQSPPRDTLSKAVTLAPAVTGLAAFREAQSQLGLGEIASARARLVPLFASDLDETHKADIAFALARSFDPSFLAALKTADATADAAEAERWYRHWYALSVKTGSVSDRVMLERLLRSLK